MLLKRIYIEITNVCNLNCTFCPPHHRTNKFMLLEEFQRILSEVKPYTKYIYLHVKGEPLLHPQIDTFVKLAHQEGFFIQLTTNGTLLSEHLPITRYLRQLNLSLHATNCAEIVTIAQKIDDCLVNFRIWNKSVNPKAIQLLEEAYQTKLPNTPTGTLDKNHFVSQEELFEWPSLESKNPPTNGFCHALSSQIAILVDGTVVPCCLDHRGEIPLGNIFEQDFCAILSSPKVQAIQEGFRARKPTEALCLQCSFKNRF